MFLAIHAKINKTGVRIVRSTPGCCIFSFRFKLNTLNTNISIKIIESATKGKSMLPLKADIPASKRATRFTIKPTAEIRLGKIAIMANAIAALPVKFPTIPYPDPQIGNVPPCYSRSKDHFFN